MIRISRKALVDPAANQAYVTVALAVTVLVTAYSSRFGPVSILVFYAFWLPLLAVAPGRIVGRTADLWLPLAVVGLMIASTVWSDAPKTTLRGALQFASHVACALVAARIASTRSLALGLLVGCLAVVLYSYGVGNYSFDRVDAVYTFVGAFASKNQLGLFCSLGALSAAAVILLERSIPLRVFALAVAAVCAAGLVASRSATSIGALLITLALTPVLLALLWFRPGTRATILLLLMPVAAGVAMVAVNHGAADQLIAAFGKDPTLTGRTYLWSEGVRAGFINPLAGAGYQAYWVQGASEAERLWSEFYVTGRSGFHFHSTWVEAFVQLGLLGVAGFAIIFLGVFASYARRVVARGDGPSAFGLALMILLLTRSFFEVDVLFPYTIGAFLLFHLAFAARRPAPVRRLAPAEVQPAARPGPPLRHGLIQLQTDR